MTLSNGRVIPYGFLLAVKKKGGGEIVLPTQYGPSKSAGRNSEGDQ